jgi:hypothetical protein
MKPTELGPDHGSYLSISTPWRKPTQSSQITQSARWPWPFDLLAKGLVSKDSREFRGPVELFVAAVAEWEGDVLRFVMAA